MSFEEVCNGSLPSDITDHYDWLLVEFPKRKEAIYEEFYEVLANYN